MAIEFGSITEGSGRLTGLCVATPQASVLDSRQSSSASVQTFPSLFDVLMHQPVEVEIDNEHHPEDKQRYS